MGDNMQKNRAAQSGSSCPPEVLEPRKVREIEHSRVRRTILKGQERQADTHLAEQPAEIGQLIRDRDGFEHHFSNMKYYSITRSSEACQRMWLRERCRPGVRALDYACGNGENGIYAAQCGAEVIGIDISPEGVANANLNAARVGLAGQCRFEVMDGENMTFDDDTFDVIVEYGALHHVELERAMAELCRVLRPQGEMICTESLRHNPVIHWYRQRTPHLRTEWEVEHILGIEHLEIMRKYFGRVEVQFFHLLALAAVPFRKTAAFHALRSALDHLDNRLLRHPWIGKYAWMMVIVLRDPRKESLSG